MEVSGSRFAIGTSLFTSKYRFRTRGAATPYIPAPDTEYQVHRARKGHKPHKSRMA